MYRRSSLLLLIVALPLAALAQTSPHSAGNTARPSLDDLLELVPDDVALVAVIQDLAAFAGGIQEFGAAIGVDDLVETDSAAILADLDITALPADWRDRINRRGPLVLAQPEPDCEPLLLATITEPADVPTGELVKIKGRILIAAPDAEILRATTSASGRFARRFKENAAATLESHGVVIFLDAPAWATKMEQMLTMGEMFAQMGAAMTSQPAQSNLALVNWLFQSLRTAYGETETLVLAGRINGDGLHFNKLIRFEPGGKIAEYLGKVRKSDKDLLRNLPAQPGMIIMGAEWTLPPDVQTFSEHMLDVMLAAAPDTPGDADWKKTTEQAKGLYRRIAGYNGVVSSAADQPGMLAHGFYLAENAPAMMDNFHALWKVSMPLMSTMAPGFEMEVTDEVEMIGSARARTYHMKFTTGDEQMQRMLNSMYGESTTFCIAPHAEGIAFAMGPGNVARQRLEKLLAGEGTPLGADPRVAAALEKLSPKPQVLVLVDLPRLMLWGLKISGVPAPPLPQEAPPPYVGLTVHLHQTSCTTELFVPARTVKALTDFVQGPAGAPTGPEAY